MSVHQLISLGQEISQSTQSLTSNEREILPQELYQFLSRANGLFAFESALMIRPLVHVNNIYSVFEWNEPGLWKSSYCNTQVLQALFFAEDAFGCQFGFFDDQIYFFCPETGEFKFLCNSFDEWCEMIVSDFELHTGYKLIHEWQSENGAIIPGFRLCPKLPFVLGGQYAVENLYSISALDGLLFRAEIANQIRNLPNGAKVRIVVD